MKHRIFVYGTLKQGFGNHHYLQSATFVGCGYTKIKYSLYVEGIPFVVKDNPTSHIFGEVYLVDDLALHRLDSLEGHPDWYRREQVAVILTDRPIQTEDMAWLYFYPEKRGRLLRSGVYEE